MYKASNQAGQQHGYIRTSELSDRKKDRRVLKAVSAGERKVSLQTPFPIKLFYWKDDNLKFGIIEVKVSNYKVHMTDLERSVCDAVKYRNKIGHALCSEIIRNYTKRTDRNLSRLSEYAKILRVEKTMKEYITITLGE